MYDIITVGSSTVDVRKLIKTMKNRFTYPVGLTLYHLVSRRIVTTPKFYEKDYRDLA